MKYHVLLAMPDFFTQPSSFAAALLGLISGCALLLGAIIGYRWHVSVKITGMVMAFGSGVLISALAFDLMEEAFSRGGLIPVSCGFIIGAFIYTIANYFLSRGGARHRKRSGIHQLYEEKERGKSNAVSIAIGALIDGIPESVAIGVSMVDGTSISLSAVAAIFISNVPEALASTSGMKKANKSFRYIFSIWCGITVLSSIAAFLGFSLFRNFSPEVIASIISVAAGGILAMLSSTMIPEAYEEVHDLTGIISAAGFLTAFIITKLVM